MEDYGGGYMEDYGGLGDVEEGPPGDYGENFESNSEYSSHWGPRSYRGFPPPQRSRGSFRGRGALHRDGWAGSQWGPPNGGPPTFDDLSGELWVETKNEEGKSYFYNARTRESRWEKPLEGPGIKILNQDQVVKLTAQLSEAEHPYGVPPPTNTSVTPSIAAAANWPLHPSGWSEHVSPTGQLYYHNIYTQKSTWEKPSELLNNEVKETDVSSLNDSSVSPLLTLPSSSAMLAAQAAADAINARHEKPIKVTDKSKPVLSTPVPGTPWCVVWTGDNRSFFYNPTTKDSVWKRPPELANRADVKEMLKSSAAAEKIKLKHIRNGKALKEGSEIGDENEEEEQMIPEPSKKKNTLLVFGGGTLLDKEKEQEEKKTEIVILNEKKSKIDAGKEAAMEAEARAARERSLIPLESRMKQFRDLLSEKEISAFSTWEKELHKIVFDSRYLLLTSKERKSVFDKYVRERAEEERREKKNRLRERREAFKDLLRDSKLNGKSSFSEFANKYGKDEKFRGIDKMRERESLYNEYLSEIRRKEKEERVSKRETQRKDFIALLKATKEIDRHSYFSESKKLIDSETRYKAVESSSLREDWFLDYIQDLKEEHRRSKRRSRSSKRSRSVSHSRRVKKDKRSKRSESKEGTFKKDKENHENDDNEEHENEEMKEEGEMTDEENHHRRRRRSKSSDRNRNETEEAKEKREKNERIANSLRKREEEVQKELSSHLVTIDREREQHRQQEAHSNFQALLADLIRHPDYTWKEAKKVLKKDDRYGNCSEYLDKSEREKIFDDHIDLLIAKKRENYWKLLDEKCRDIGLADLNFKDIKNEMKDDPRYAKYSSSDRKCEKQFNEYLKNRVTASKTSLKELLKETKKITDKSLALVKDKSSGHLDEIIEQLKKDKRYLDLQCLEDERMEIIMNHLEDVEKRGPPPPPTASEPSRRSKI